jgi:PAS domain S-box-containing protein
LEQRVKDRTQELETLNEELTAKILEGDRAAKELEESEFKYKNLTDNLNVGVYRNNGPEGRFIEANPAIVKMFGYENREEFLEINTSELYQNQVDRDNFVEQMKEKGSVIGVELSLKKKDGTPFIGSLSTVAVKDESGEIKWYDGIVEDVSERKLLEQQFTHAQKMEAIGTLAGGLAHDFNNLLMGIQGYVSMMLWDVDSIHQHYEFLKNVENQVKSGARLTAQLLGFAREGRYEVQPIQINELLSETSEAFARTRKEITVHLNLDEDVYPIEADKGQIEQVLLNLYINAADAMQAGGELRLSTRNATEKDLRNKPYRPREGDYVMLTIADTGAGMSEETQARIFEPFFTTKELGRGTGLGLASVYGIIKGHRGYIDVDSAPGRGTTFTICLPASERAVQESKKSEFALRAGNETILLVDDEPVVSHVASQMLQRLGYSILVAGSDEEAIEIYGKNHDKIDLVLLDMIMPGMSGAATYESVKAIDGDAKVLLCSGYSIEGQAREILDRGCDGFIQKPFHLSEVSHKVKDILHGD